MKMEKPYLTYSIDGNQVCAVGPDFTDLQESDAGFGDSLRLAFEDYWKQNPDLELDKLCKWELKFLLWGQSEN